MVVAYTMLVWDLTMWLLCLQMQLSALSAVSLPSFFRNVSCDAVPTRSDVSMDRRGFEPGELTKSIDYDRLWHRKDPCRRQMLNVWKVNFWIERSLHWCFLEDATSSRCTFRRPRVELAFQEGDSCAVCQKLRGLEPHLLRQRFHPRHFCPDNR